MTPAWGHLNVNVTNLERSIAFYGRLGFSMMLEGIPHLGLSLHHESALPDTLCEAYGLPGATRARGCILQLGDGFPKLDLTEYSTTVDSAPLGAGALGCERFCLAVEDLAAEIERLARSGVPVLTGATTGEQDLAQVAVCLDPDGTRIELIQLDLGRFVELGFI